MIDKLAHDMIKEQRFIRNSDSAARNNTKRKSVARISDTILPTPINVAEKTRLQRIEIAIVYTLSTNVVLERWWNIIERALTGRVHFESELR